MTRQRNNNQVHVDKRLFFFFRVSLSLPFCYSSLMYIAILTTNYYIPHTYTHAYVHAHVRPLFPSASLFYALWLRLSFHCVCNCAYVIGRSLSVRHLRFRFHLRRLSCTSLARTWSRCTHSRSQHSLCGKHHENKQNNPQRLGLVASQR